MKPFRPNFVLSNSQVGRWCALVAILTGLLVLMWPHDQAWKQWSMARQAWSYEQQAMHEHDEDDLLDERQVQAQMRACKMPDLTALFDDCMNYTEQHAQTTLGLLAVMATRYASMISMNLPGGDAVLRHRITDGQAALNHLAASAQKDQAAWAVLVQVFQKNLTACNAVMPAFACAWWLRDDAKTWRLSWDNLSTVHAPSDLQTVPNFVKEQRVIWNTWLKLVNNGATSILPLTGDGGAVVSTTTPLDALSNDSVLDDPRDRARFRSDRVRERYQRPTDVKKSQEEVR